MVTVRLIYVHSLLWYQLDNDTMLFVSFLEQIWGLPKNWDELVFVLFIKMYGIYNTSQIYHSQIRCSVANCNQREQIAIFTYICDYWACWQFVEKSRPNVRCQALDWQQNTRFDL